MRICFAASLYICLYTVYLSGIYTRMYKRIYAATPKLPVEAIYCPLVEVWELLPIEHEMS